MVSQVFKIMLPGDKQDDLDNGDLVGSAPGGTCCPLMVAFICAPLVIGRDSRMEDLVLPDDFVL